MILEKKKVTVRTDPLAIAALIAIARADLGPITVSSENTISSPENMNQCKAPAPQKV